MLVPIYQVHGKSKIFKPSATIQIYLTSAPWYSPQLRAREEVAWSMKRQDGSTPPTAPTALPDRVLYYSSIQYSLLKCWHNGPKVNYRNRTITCDEQENQIIFDSLVTEQQPKPPLHSRPSSVLYITRKPTIPNITLSYLKTVRTNIYLL